MPTSRDPHSQIEPKDLQVDVAALRRRGIDHQDVVAELDVPFLEQVLADTDAEIRDPGRLTAALHLQPGGVIFVSGELQVAFTVPCGRCLEAASVAEALKLSAVFVEGDLPATGPAGSDAEGEEGLSLSADDLDAWTYDGSVLDLAGLVAEHVKLSYPMRALCGRGEDCRGLCSSCGAGLNEQQPSGTCERCQSPLEGIARGGAPEAPKEGALAEALKKLQFPD